MNLAGKSTKLLQELRVAIESAPENQSGGGLFLHTPHARRKLEKIAEQITHNMAMKRKAAGNPVKVDGYSGRKQNRR
jgi:hypothetical protein